MQKLRTYHVAVEFHRLARAFKVPGYLRDQWLRATASIVLNLAEGSAKPSAADRNRCYRIALGSLRSRRRFWTSLLRGEALVTLADELGAHLYRLVKASGSQPHGHPATSSG